MSCTQHWFMHLHTPVLVYDVADDERSEEEQAVAGHGALRLHVDLLDGDDFALRRSRLPHHLQTPMRPAVT